MVSSFMEIACIQCNARLEVAARLIYIKESHFLSSSPIRNAVIVSAHICISPNEIAHSPATFILTNAISLNRPKQFIAICM